MKRHLHSILIIIILGMAQVANAQSSIKIYDAKTLEPLMYAAVQAKDLTTLQTFNGITDNFGEIDIPFTNTYSVEVSFIGYDKLRKEIQPGRTGILYMFQKQSEVNEVVITAQSKETSQKESLYTVKVINREEIDKRAAVNLSNALQNELNIQMANDGVLGSQVNIQGFGGSNVKIMIDGVPVIGRVDGNIDLNQINLNNIERIEIVEGPLSAIYGSNAIAGVVNLITKSNQKNKVDGAVNTYYESIGTYNIDANVGLKLKKHVLQLKWRTLLF